MWWNPLKFKILLYMNGYFQMSTGDYTNWDTNQPDITDQKYCVRIQSDTFRWNTVQCTGIQPQYDNPFLCQSQACELNLTLQTFSAMLYRAISGDAYKYCDE